MTDDRLLQTLDRIENNIASVDAKINNWLATECPNRHVQIEARMSKLEVRVYLACGAIILFLNVFGPRILDLIKRI